MESAISPSYPARVLNIKRRESAVFLGIEGGGTRTVAVAANQKGELLARAEAGPANLTLLDTPSLIELLRLLASHLPRPDSVAIGLAGSWSDRDRQRIRAASDKAWPEIPCYPTNDLETALTAAGHRKSDDYAGQVLIVSGTGSCCYGKNGSGTEVKVGGWGHLLGDKGSGYEIGLRALKASIYYYDRDRVWPSLGASLLRALQLNEPYDLVEWAQRATKAEIGRLALQVFAAWETKDKIANDILTAAATSLARDGVTCAKQLRLKRGRVRFILAGSSLLKQPRFAAAVGKQLKKLWPGAAVSPLPREGVWGAVELAQRLIDKSPSACVKSRTADETSEVQSPKSPAISNGPAVHGPMVSSSQMSPTEERNPRSRNWDKMPLRQAIELMLAEDAKIPRKLMPNAARIEKVVRAITRAFNQGGHLFYVGAGTSGRLGVLDASECPPTFRTPSEMVQAIIAGGDSALRHAIEGAEDDPAAGAAAIAFRHVGRRDVVIGIAASGTTPYVWGALGEAKRRGAFTVLLCFNPYLKIPAALRPNVVIDPNLGPELLTGSTRLKAGTATKLILNIFTTLAMVRIGKVIGNLMVDMQPGNAKLRDRATRIVHDLTGRDRETARKALEASDWIIKKAVARLGRK